MVLYLLSMVSVKPMALHRTFKLQLQNVHCVLVNSETGRERQETSVKDNNHICT